MWCIEDIRTLDLPYDLTPQTQTFTSKDVEQFAKLSGDVNPLHLDQNWISQYRELGQALFDKPIVHGTLVLGGLSKIFGTYFPGPGCLFLDTYVAFRNPVYPDFPVTYFVNLYHVEGHKLFFDLEVYQQSGQLEKKGGTLTVESRQVLSGTCKIWVPSKEKR